MWGEGRSRTELSTHPLCTHLVQTSYSSKQPLQMKTAYPYFHLESCDMSRDKGRQEEEQSVLTPHQHHTEMEVCSTAGCSWREKRTVNPYFFVWAAIIEVPENRAAKALSVPHICIWTLCPGHVLLLPPLSQPWWLDSKATIGLNSGYGSTHCHALSVSSQVDLMGNYSVSLGSFLFCRLEERMTFPTLPF